LSRLSGDRRAESAWSWWASPRTRHQMRGHWPTHPQTPQATNPVARRSKRPGLDDSSVGTE
jgi:hypothetical protein